MVTMVTIVLENDFSTSFIWGYLYTKFKVYRICVSRVMAHGQKRPSPTRSLKSSKKPGPNRVKGERLSVAAANNFC